MISSLDNPRIKLVKSLVLKKYRDKEKKFTVEGIHLVEEAMSAAEFGILSALFSKKAAKTHEGQALLKRLAKSGIELLEVSEPVMKEISDVEEPQGIIAIVNCGDATIDDLTHDLNPLIVVCAGIQDPGNLGGIIRSSDAMGCTGILTGSGTVDIYNSKTVRASMGSIFHLPIVEFPDVAVGMRRLKEKGVKLVATTLDAEVVLEDEDMSKAVGIVLGGEGAGLPDAVKKLCDRAVKIPMKGKAESLNVAAAGAMILYEAMRQRSSGRKN